MSTGAGNERTNERAARRGVTLLEVMFSIGVATVGLLSVIALFPLGAYRMRKGIASDRAGAMGQSAVAEFDVRGMGRPDMWAVWNPNAGVNAFVPFVSNPAVWALPVAFPVPLTGVGASFCIDPQYVARAVNDGHTLPTLFPDVPTAVLPLDQSPEPRMARVTLRTTPGASPVLAGNPNPLFTIPRTVADEIFFLNDDLLFERPTDATQPPVGVFSYDLNANPEKRQYEGSMSWLATLSPILAATGGPAHENLYTLSIVVFENRNLDTDIKANVDVTMEPIETVLNVPIFSGLGGGGGDVTFATRPGRPKEDLEQIRPGSWVMLGARLRDPETPATPGAAVFRWYKIESVDAESVLDTTQTLDPNYDVWGREVFLDGGDWNPNVAFPTQATILSGVVAVFEKTIRLENSSLWTP
ncbi:MAG: hypothetical protein FJ297_15905 [Planctomycetes bacterium]|nr:hypothetical protein [Planctomycetota bacterium]